MVTLSLGDNILRGYVEDDSPQTHLGHPVDNGNEDDESRPLGGTEDPAKPEYNTSFIFIQNLYRACKKENDYI